MKTLQEIIDKGKRIVFFGGAGVSTESGIPDFRSTDGLYNQKYDYPPEVILSDEFFYTHTEEFFRFYRDKMLFPDAQPNAAHKKLFELEKAGKLRGIVTQNIDGLHRMAGNKLVYELHGTVYENTCLECGKKYGLDFMLNSTGVPRCACGGVVKPDVVLYGESLDQNTIIGACREISQADVLIVAGTSLMVQPAASFLDYFSGRDLVVINRDATSADRKASLVLHERVGEVLGAIKVNP
ncbi:MAG: NAD-dependent protein deacylase [Clostridia bacterium]|nr:NAD-dependent protein deacylase [Clostridia bacterium]MBR4442798.1 NAD-dependent protein deacylase [Clostridia bacterium]MBR6499221.1 NAD-dependent protein deacylase [Clostridia bacterium]